MVMNTSARGLWFLNLQHALRPIVTIVPDTSVVITTRLKSVVLSVVSITATKRCLEVMLSGVLVTRTAKTRATSTALSATALILSASRIPIASSYWA